MKRRGSITIYLTIIMLSVILLINVIAESARVSAVQAKCKSITYMAGDSVMAGYARQVYDDYGLLLVWNKSSVEETMKSYIQANIQMADMNVTGYDFLNARLESIEANNLVRVTDKGGEAFVDQVKKYLKYAGLTKAINEIKNRSSDMKEESKEDVTDDLDDEDSDYMSLLVMRIDKKITDISNSKKLEEYQSDIEQACKDFKKKKFIKVFEDVAEELEDLKSDIEDVLDLIKEYSREKNSLLKKHGYKNTAEDYVTTNREKLLKAVEKINALLQINCEEYLDVDKKTAKERMASIFDQNEYIITKINSLKTNKVTEKDKHNYSIYKSAKKILNNGILGLVVDNTAKLSDASISTDHLPSNNMSEGKSSALEDKAAMALYTYFYFGNYTDCNKKDVLQYGLEYLATGEDSDKDNLASVVKRLVAIRHVPNMACLLKDGAKMGEIETIAASIAAVTGLPFLEPVAKVILIEAWTLAESICDVRLLLKKQKLRLIKTTANWRTSLTNLLVKSEKGDDGGLEYIAYLEGLIMLCSRNEVVYRTMDLIQMNICKRYNNEFRMKNSIMRFGCKAKFSIAPMFASMPWMVDLLGADDGGYELNVSVKKKYD